ncbi:DExH-box ATP-dependent RNA helicase DExH5, mitochondrial-like isoform X2 [Cucurbita pepo subsp. pepo]|uniref:DExH-box ATP-dependent RNA helicase DExH5, mitochondrial-like isoform X2 n=1 Tax=Cucurbita pepo subsp. pepo TaxID=3664 RepID=UPI000C9D99B2|nr:DExH-box ATP-dependent RNA helicase DExH5, mitochondrial-like isoform X2 [Cucurbita pepo subsp. pepo]
MKDRTPSSNGAVYVPPHLRLRSVVTRSDRSSAVSAVDCKLREAPASLLDSGTIPPPCLDSRSQELLSMGKSRFNSVHYDFACDDGAPVDSWGFSPPANIDLWKRKLAQLLRDKEKQELVSREKKDRHDFEQIAALASRMGLFSHLYAKVAVFSKVPLPNYRFDLDDRRPQREVSLPPGLLRRVDEHLGEFLSQKSRFKCFLDNSVSRSSSSGSIATDEGLFEQPELQASSKAVMEKILWRRSLHLRDQQHAWQSSLEGREMLEFRKKLPAYKEKDALLTTISQNQVIIISGETGCGKTTQVPQFILESEIESLRGAVCSIICTQPRRISAMSVSERVASERGEKLGESVGYKVRLEGMKGRDTHLLFCTTGILLRRLLVDRNLKGVTHVIVDEIHERGMNEDFLLIVLKDLLPRRPELRLILMSATLDAELFSSYFGGAQIIYIPGFTHPVKTHFLEDILEMTGYRLTPYNQIDDYGPEKTWKMSKQAPRKRKTQIASTVQRLIFTEPDKGVRKVVLATNIAETSITINDVVFVLDCGKAKETSYDALNNTPCLLPSWISKVSAQQRRGRAGRVQPGECYHLYPRSVFDSFFEYQLPEILRTPLQSLCLQIKSLKLGSISEFLSRALQSPELLAVQNAIEYLKIIGAFDESENLTVLGRYLTMLPMEPKLGKMLIIGSIFNCLDPILSIVAGFSVRDPFLTPLEKKDAAEAAKSQFSRDHSDHLAIIRAYEGWKEAERNFGGYDFCWKNFLSVQSMKAIDSLRKEFFSLLRDTGLVDEHSNTYNAWSLDERLIRAVICCGLYPGVCSIVHNEKSFSLKTMEDGQVLLYSNSVNARESRIPYPWIVFNEKIKVNSIFLRDSTAISDSMLLLFGGSISKGDQEGHLKMLGGFLEFFMKPDVAETYQKLRMELEELIQMKLLNPTMDLHSHHELLSAIRLLISEDQCEGRFTFGRQILQQPSKKSTLAAAPNSVSRIESGPGGDNSKSQLQTLLTRAGYAAPIYKTKQLKNNHFQATVEFNGLQIMGQPCTNKKNAEKDAAAKALEWLMGGNQIGHDYINQMSMMLKRSKKDHN